jgi:hypothetical protein
MDTTVKIDPELLREARQIAERSGRSLTSVIEDALRESFARQRGYGHSERIRLVTFKGNGLLSNIDLDHSADLLDTLESLDDSHR